MVEPTTPKEMLIGKKYRVKSVLGEGGMGTVYEAVNESLGSRVAVKVLKGEFIGDDKVLERFRKEARLLASINDLNICPVMDYGRTDEGRPFFAMPCLEGDTLKALLAKKSPFPFNRVFDIVIQTLSALKAVHFHNAVHRDLKPSNIFVSTLPDGRDFVRLLDFGVVKTMETTTMGTTIVDRTESGVIIGTPSYMSPEQVDNSRDTDSRADIWAAGVIFYEAMTGRNPFAGEKSTVTLYNVCNKRLQPPRELNSRIPEAIENIILKALARSIPDRYQSADEMLTAILNSRASFDADGDVSTMETFSKSKKDRTDSVSKGLKGYFAPIRRDCNWKAYLALIILVVVSLLALLPSEEKTPPPLVEAEKGGILLRRICAVSSASGSEHVFFNPDRDH